MNKRRLLKLADLLEADAKKKKGVKFDLGTWAKPASGNHYDVRNITPKVDCSTAACAVGLACISGAFNRQGLTYGTWFNSFYSTYFLVPRFGRRKEWPAVSAFFDIKKQEAYRLFSPMHYVKTTGAKAERAVAKRIRDFVGRRRRDLHPRDNLATVGTGRAGDQAASAGRWVAG